MIRRILAALVFTVLMVGIARADDVKGTLEKVDTDKNTVSLKKDKHLYKVGDSCKFMDAEGKELTGGLKSEALKEGTDVVLTIEGKKKNAAITVCKIAKKE